MNSSQMDPDPDVAGPGAMISLLVTGLFATLSSCAASTLSILADDKHQLWQRYPRTRAHLLDRLRILCPAHAENPAAFWNPILGDFVLDLSDQQLISGLLIVTLTFAKYYRNNIVTASIACDLVFFSMITHFATILTIGPMLRAHFKLAVLRLSLVLATLIFWLVLNLMLTYRLWKSGVSLSTPIFTIATITYLFEMVGMPWIFWDVCLSLFMRDPTRKLRTALSRVTLKPSDQNTIIEWLECHQETTSTPNLEGNSAHVVSYMKKPFSWILKIFCRRYIRPKSRCEQLLLWTLAEICFPFRFGNVAQVILLLLGTLNLILDLKISGLADSWGFGQLLPMFMLLLPFISLAEAYADKDRSREGKREEDDK